MAAWAAAARPRGGVLVIHENRGLTEHIRTVAGRLAASGYF
jgi:carboxymethylenebutenolidase